MRDMRGERISRDPLADRNFGTTRRLRAMFAGRASAGSNPAGGTRHCRGHQLTKASGDIGLPRRVRDLARAARARPGSRGSPLATTTIEAQRRHPTSRRLPPTFWTEWRSEPSFGNAGAITPSKDPYRGLY